MDDIHNKTQSTSIVKNAFNLTSSKIITLIISFITIMVLSRALTLEEYGTYSQILLVINLFTSLLMLGLPNSINYFIGTSESNLEKEKFLSTYYILSSLLSFFIGLILVIFTPFIVNYFNNPSLNSFFYIFAILPWTKIIMSGIENILISYKKISYIHYYRIANSLALLIIVMGLYVWNFSFQTYMSLYLLIQIIFTIIVYLIVRKQISKLYLNIDMKIIKNVFKFSIPIGLASMVGTINIQLDKLMIGKFTTTEQLAIYTNASRELPISIIATSLIAILLPEVVRLVKKNDYFKAIQLWGNTSILSFIIISFFVSVIYVFALEIITILYSSKYESGLNIFRIYSITLLLKFTYFGLILNAKGKTKFVFYSSVISLILNVILNYILFYFIGLEGPALATLISQLVINIIQLIYTSKIIGVRFRQILPWRTLTQIVFINLFMCIIFIFIKNFSYDILPWFDLYIFIILLLLWFIIYLLIFYNKTKKILLELK